MRVYKNAIYQFQLQNFVHPKGLPKDKGFKILSFYLLTEYKTLV